MSDRFDSTPRHAAYDVVIVGGAIMGSSTAFFLTRDPDFQGRILVIERDPTYQFASTSLSHSCIRQQYSTDLNVRISQYTARFIQNMRDEMGGDERVPNLKVQNFGYLYLAADQAMADTLRANHAVQTAAGAGTQLMTPDEIAARWPFYALDDIGLGSFNDVDEGYFDGATVFDWFKRIARDRGVEYVANEVVAMTERGDGTGVESVTLASGEVIECDWVVNASGPRAAQTAAMAGIEVPVEPRKRQAWVFRAERPLSVELPLTIDPSGITVRELGGGTYLSGGYADADPGVAPTDFERDPDLWEDKVWPLIAARVPAFEAIRVTSEWVGQYAMNTFDHNAITGPHERLTNFLFLNGFSGHGLQQSPAMGRGTAEWIVHGRYQSLDLTDFHFDRIKAGNPIPEKAVI